MFGRKTLEFMLICIGDEMRDEAVSKVTDTASFLGYYSNVTLMEGFYAAIL